jgi:glycerate 2-kinase
MKGGFSDLRDEAMTATAPRDVLTDIFQAALRGGQAAALLAAYGRFDGEAFAYDDGVTRGGLDIPAGGRVVVVGAGKQAAPLAQALEATLGERITLGRLIVPYGGGLPLQRIEVLEAGDPTPDPAGLTATRSLIRAVSNLTAEDRVFVILTSGASALLVAPADGVSLQGKQAATDLLVNAGATPHEINAVRRRLSQVKGGGLLAAIGPARSLTLLVPETPGGDPALVGSGPTFPDTSPPAEALSIVMRRDVATRLAPDVLRRLAGAPEPPPARRMGEAAHLAHGDSAAFVSAAAEHARTLGYTVQVLDAYMAGETEAFARAFAHELRDVALTTRRPTVLLAAGQTTLPGDGAGGRCQAFALVAARELGRSRGALLAAATNGVDGTSEAAGAFADGSTLKRADALGLDLSAALAGAAPHDALAALGDLYVSGPTGTDAMDLVVGLAGPPPA